MWNKKIKPSIRTLILSGALTLALAACNTAPVREVTDLFKSYKGSPALAAGITQYEDGSFADAIKNLQTSLDQGLSTSDQVKARKYLAFSYCVSSRERLCREEFRKALELNPNFELDPAEAGHPIWGPVFRSVKARK
ncbi:MAG: TssQ family T6SS-associated lipoprotein [Proteobacteria bacterium]|nr:TssQ family T6SS-associated lipoprotein [Pseudomonadota bacterium]